MAWRADDIDFHLVADLTAKPLVTIEISTPDGSVVVMAEPEERGRTLILWRLHMEGAVANAFGPANLRVLADVVMERMNYDDIIIEGAARTSGANPGRRPGPLRFTRRPVPAPRAGFEAC